MKITALYVYPIKALRGIPLETAQLGPQGVQYDRRFMLFKAQDEPGPLKTNMQLSRFPQCSLFEQSIAGDKVVVRYHAPAGAAPPPQRPGHQPTLKVPLNPDLSGLEPVEVDLHNSPASAAYSMGAAYNDWFSECFGFRVHLVYIGDGRREVLGSLPPNATQQNTGGWLSTLASYMPGTKAEEPSWITFTDVAPFLITSDASLRNVHARFPGGEAVDMYKFRPNIVVEGEDAWAEDFWAELVVRDSGERIVLTANCGRCASLNVDYQTGRPAQGELGTVLKKLMKDRRVDKGYKYAPVFGRYGFLMDAEHVQVSVGDEVDVTKRITERMTFAWPGL